MQKKIVLFAAAISLLLGAVHANSSFIYDDSEDQYMLISKCHPSKQGPQGPPGTSGGVVALGSYYCYSLDNSQKNVIVPATPVSEPVPFDFVASQMGGISCQIGWPVGGGNGVITISDPGTWLITCGASWDSDDTFTCSSGSSSLRGCAIFRNNSPIAGTAMFNNAAVTNAVDTIFTTSTIIHLDANDQITVQPFDNNNTQCQTLQLDCNENQEGRSLDNTHNTPQFSGPFIIPVCHITLMKIAP